jgi:hypothetical protein
MGRKIAKWVCCQLNGGHKWRAEHFPVGSTRLYKALQGTSRKYKAVQGITRQYKALQGSTKQYKAV